MKSFINFFAVIAFVLVSLAACKKEEDPCDKVTCLNGASCNNGSCSCAAGYEGSTCGTEVRAKFLSVYNVSESCTSGNFTYSMTINTSATGVSNVLFSNFGGYNINVNGSVSGNSVTIPNQTVDISGVSVTISGSGQVSGNILTLTYTASAMGSSDTCTATCTKQ